MPRRAPERFDHERIYYRVVGDNDRYIYNHGEPAIIAGGRGLVTADRPYFEFDPLDRVGRWLTLGDRVRRLRVPPDAVIEVNTPMSQGGCYTWSADRVELLEIIDFAELMRNYDSVGIAADFLSFHAHEFPAHFRFPERVGTLHISRSLAVAPLDLPARLEQLFFGWSAARIGRVPGTLDVFEARDTLFEGLAGPPPARRVELHGCVFFP